MREEFGVQNLRYPLSIKFVDDLKKDVERRDFTINALAYQPNQGIVDYLGGINDLNNRIIKFIKDPNISIVLDPIRLIRALRFSLTLGFDIDENDYRVMVKECKRVSELGKIRFDELERICNIDGVKNHLLKHYNIYLAEKIPAIEENKEQSLEVLAEIESLKPDAAKKEFKENWHARFGIKFLTSRLTSFAREVSDSVCRRLEPFRQDTEDPQYLQFDDMTEELKDEFKNGTTRKVKLPNGTYLEPYCNLDGGYTVYNGKVYKAVFGQLKHRKRNKRAKKMQVVEVPNRKLYKTYEEFAEERYTFNSETGTYGCFWNPQAFYDWFSIGGRWPCEFLVKEDCFESSLGEIDYEREPTKAPDGYKWVCFARKKDIQWQVMRDIQYKDLSEDYEYLKACFNAGEMLKEEDKEKNYYSRRFGL